MSAPGYDEGTRSTRRSHDVTNRRRRPRPPAGSIRIEEVVNAFDHGYAPPEEGDFAIRIEGAADPHVEGWTLLRVGIQGRRIEPAERGPVDLVLVVDVSGSMAEGDRLPLVKESLALLIEALEPDDRIAVVAFSDAARVVLPFSDLGAREAIGAAIDALSTEGGTNVAAGLALAAEVAVAGARAEASPRLVLCSDGLANQGATGLDALLGAVAPAREKGAALTVLGFGLEYADHDMERLADLSDGACAFVDRLGEARRALVDSLDGTIRILARDARAQVEFDPEVVEEWVRLGYENRAMAADGFRDDAADAGEVGFGHAATALFRLRTRGESTLPAVTVRLRWRDPNSGEFRETSLSIPLEDLAGDVALASASFRRTAALARFAEVLRGDVPEPGPALDRLATELRPLSSEEPWTDLVTLVESARRLVK